MQKIFKYTYCYDGTAEFDGGLDDFVDWHLEYLINQGYKIISVIPTQSQIYTTEDLDDSHRENDFAYAEQPYVTMVNQIIVVVEKKRSLKLWIKDKLN